MRGMGSRGNFGGIKATMGATMGGIGATMGGYMASIVAPIPPTKDSLGSFTIMNTCNSNE
jgi:hypothetical protein